jgi:oligopeptidase B
MLMLATIALFVSLLAWSPPPMPVASISAAVPVKIDPDIVRPPVAKKVTTEQMIHFERRVDDYGWLREKSDPEVISYIRAENDYTAEVMRPTLAFQETLYQEILANIHRTEISPPYAKGGYWYYQRLEEGKQYPIQCRRPGHLDGTEQVVLDLNALASGQPYFAVHEQAVSDDGRLLAYTTDTTGSRDFILHVRDLESGRHLSDRVEHVRSLAWAADNRTLFYVVEDAAKRPYRLYRRVVHGGPDELVCEERDEHFRLYVRRSIDGQYVLADSQSLATTETSAVPSMRPAEAPRVILPRIDRQFHVAEHRDGRFYVRTNRDALDFRLISFADSESPSGAWREVVPAREGVALEDFRLFHSHAVVLERERGLPSLRVLDLNTGSNRVVVLPSRVCAINFEPNAQYESTRCRFRYSTPITPDVIFEYDMVAHKLEALDHLDVARQSIGDRYAVERTQATARDGTFVPVTLIYRKGVPRDGSAPSLLFGYGAYGAPLEVNYDPSRFSLLDRGVICVLAHVRGGGDLGKRWQEQGKIRTKLNSITDLIAVAEDLVARRYTSPDRIALQSLSGGGVLMGGAMNLRPDLFRAAVLQGPFLDVVNSMLDPTLPLTVPEYLEWGDPRRKDEYESMKAFCPYTNLRRQAYPAMLLWTSLNDSQVMYWEPVKYVAKLRGLKTDANPLLLRVRENAGHKGASGRYDALREKAFTYAFLLSQIGARP